MHVTVFRSDLSAGMAGRCVFVGADKEPCLLYEECQIPEISEGEVLARIRLATICGSDLHTVDGRRKEAVPRYTIMHATVYTLSLIDFKDCQHCSLPRQRSRI